MDIEFLGILGILFWNSWKNGKAWLILFKIQAFDIYDTFFFKI